MRRFKGIASVLVLPVVLAVLYGCALFNSPPLASFDVAPSTGSAPLAVQVNASASFDADGDELTFRWDFGDGSFGVGAVTAHTYGVAGQYTIRLTVTDSQAQEASIAQTVWVLEESDLPEAAFTASPSSGGTPLTVAFNAAASTAQSGSISTYSWAFGDGSTGSGVSVFHTYAAEGSYLALLTVTDDEGFSDSMSMLIVVIDGGQGGCS